MGLDADRERRRFEVAGIVQGVGFRPFVHRLAERLGLDGFVLNDGRGVVIEAEGGAGRRSTPSPPRCAPRRRRSLAWTAWREALVSPNGARGFVIAPSAAVAGPGTARIPPDLRHLRGVPARAVRPGRPPPPLSRSSTARQCGPRFTIVRRVPYDRPHTTMAGFPMCADCRREYEDPSDRRFHAEPIACPGCGPQLSHAARGRRRAAAGGRDPGRQGPGRVPPGVRRRERGGRRAPARAQAPRGQALRAHGRRARGAGGGRRGGGPAAALPRAPDRADGAPRRRADRALGRARAGPGWASCCPTPRSTTCSWPARGVRW